MSSLREDDRNKPVIGYPTAYPPGHPNYEPNTYTGYPYPAPSPNHNPYPAPSYSRSSNTFLRRLLIFLIAVMIIFSAISFISWLVFRPHLPEFRVDMVNISLNASASVISPNWEFGFLVENPNKKADICYDVMQVSLFYKGEFLCETDVSPFEQGKNTESLLWAGFKDVEKKIVDLISEDSKHGMVSMNVEVMGWIRFEAGALRIRPHLMRVLCVDVGIQFNSSTNLGTWAGGNEMCQDLFEIFGISADQGHLLVPDLCLERLGNCILEIRPFKQEKKSEMLLIARFKDVEERVVKRGMINLDAQLAGWILVLDTLYSNQRLSRTRECKALIITFQNLLAALFADSFNPSLPPLSLMSTSRDDDPNKTVTGYPASYPPTHPNYNPSDPNTCTGYPYPVPPPNPNPSHAPAYNPNARAFRRRLFIALIAALLIFCTISSISWFAFRPHPPEFRIDSVYVPPINSSLNGYLSDWQVIYVVKNPNKMSLYYDEVDTGFFYNETFLFDIDVKPFDQEKKSEITLVARFKDVDEDAVGTLISEDRKRGMVSFNVQLISWIRLKHGGLRTRFHLMTVVCNDVRVQFTVVSGSGTLASGLEKCQVDVN
ncbi:hypothetical protein IFM89_018881 [Coptis chinensis]|uniref:Late embryogenesis abundant protein LEA-2 subgroup domain-containing protein n=1 Tax=Coptis chinensis TaxID=261450 RepID=A0A835HE43_9MAGN|nr:hypothetical protein IFM89_018881 [Coptis chinensis]